MIKFGKSTISIAIFNSKLLVYWRVNPHISPINQGLVNVPIEHHPTIGDIKIPTDIASGDIQNPQKGTFTNPHQNPI